MMRGADVLQESMFTVRTLNDFVPAEHPLRPIRELLNAALTELDELFAGMYSEFGRESIAPERLLRGLVLQALYSIRSERQLCEQLGYNMLFRWFVGIGMDDSAWDHSTYTKNRERLLEHAVMRELFARVIARAQAEGLLSGEHFSVDGTLIRAWASHKSFVPKDGPPPPKSGSRNNPEVDYKGAKITNDTHESTTDPESRLYTKSAKVGAIPCYMGHALMENRHGLVIDTRLTQASGIAEREAALAMLAARPGAHGKTVGADKSYDHAAFVEGCRELGVTPHVAQNISRRASRIDERTTRHPGYALSQCIRKLIETLFADGKQHGVLRQVKLRGRERVDQVFTLAMTVANLRRLPKLIALHASG